MAPNLPQVEVQLKLPTSTILKIFASILLAWITLKLWPEVVFLAISLLFAVALDPVVAWLERRRISRGFSVMLIAGAMFVLLGLIIALVVPPLAQQIADLIANFAGVRTHVLRDLPRDNVALHTLVEQMLLLPSSPAFVAAVNKPLVWGQAAAAGLMTTFVVLIATIYLLLDGRRLYAWLLAYVPRAHREKMAETVPQVSKVVYAYVRGQVITSLLLTVFSATVLTILDVPAVLPLALLAGLCDVIPVLGIVVATIPAALLALTVTPLAAGLVMGTYVLYHLFESYFIVPRVYGSTLRLSSLSVLLALIVGGTLQGLLGAALVLPLVAAYPIIERIWLKSYLGREVLADHRALATAIDSGSDSAVNTVLQGEKHPEEGTSV